MLIDPGEFCFIEGKLKPEDIPTPDVLLLTHEHPDHYSPQAIKKISRGKKPTIITSARLSDLLKKEGLDSITIKADTTVTSGPFTISAFSAPHGPAFTVPDNLGFVINNKVAHPGDSLEFSLPQNIEVIALPIIAPWAIVRYAVDFGIKLKPKLIIPIHDAIMKDFMLSVIYNLGQKKFAEAGIEFKALNLGESLEIPD